MSIQVQVLGSIQIQDNSVGVGPFVKPLANLTVEGSSFIETNQAIIGTSITTLALPVSPCQFIYIKNLLSTSAAGTVSVTWTPNGGSSNPVQTLEPGSFLMAGQYSTGAGITALSVSASTASVPIEYILAG